MFCFNKQGTKQRKRDTGKAFIREEKHTTVFLPYLNAKQKKEYTREKKP